jgi:predicted nucleic acid-binding protein
VPTFLPDTSCIVAAICSWHEHHERASFEIQSRLNRKQRMVMAAPALVEAYSVLTRLPAPHRLSPDAALSLIEANFMQGIQTAALTASGYALLLRAAPDTGISGGRIYDAVIAACARKANVDTLLTFNDLHFAFASSELEVVVPGSS